MGKGKGGFVTFLSLVAAEQFFYNAVELLSAASASCFSSLVTWLVAFRIAGED